MLSLLLQSGADNEKPAAWTGLLPALMRSRRLFTRGEGSAREMTRVPLQHARVQMQTPCSGFVAHHGSETPQESRNMAVPAEQRIQHFQSHELTLKSAHRCQGTQHTTMQSAKLHFTPVQPVCTFHCNTGAR